MATKNPIVKRFKAPTPTKWRVAGWLGLTGSVALFMADQLAVVPHIIPFPEHAKPYVQFGILAVGILGKLCTNLAVKK